jgi:hypothetical protein
MYCVGLDIHQRSTSVEILDCNGKLVKRGEWKLPWPQLADQLKKDVRFLLRFASRPRVELPSG